MTAEPQTLSRLAVSRLGARGDGIAETPDGPVFVPFALPGESVLAEVHGERGRLIAVETPSPERQAPVSPYFTRCGGCVAQHMGPDLYRRWKVEALATALARAGIGHPLDPLVDAHGRGRRRVVFHAREIGGATEVGFMAARSHDLVPIDHCPILEPGLGRAAAVAREIAKLLAHRRKPLDIQLTATTAGLDADVRGQGRVDDATRLRLAEAAKALDLARLSLHGDVVLAPRPPALPMGKAMMVPPPGGFLQATALGEETLAGLVADACAGRKPVADLFCGCGPFALRLAEGADVHAVESDEAALAALDRAARHTQGLKRITTERRDLFRRPLLPPEIERFGAVVFDPPRAGAEAQARQIAASRIGLVVAVSCDPGTFARDAAILVAGGFAPQRIVPVDQFRYSAHIETVGVFTRQGERHGERPRERPRERPTKRKPRR